MSLSGLSRVDVRRAVGLTLTALLVVGVLASALLAWQARGEETSPTDGRAAGRDAAVQAATDGLKAFHTIDYRDLDGLIDTWSDVTAGQLHAMVGKGEKAVLRDLKRSRTVSTTEIGRIALSSYDADAGEARAVALVTIQTKKKGTEKTTRVTEFLCFVERGSDGWKLSAMQRLGGQS
ncbi:MULTISPECIES: hypothetical protein [unclassified Nocardioides]|uniref:hypothetical protein n=1 Tax=unclassified Nocardioides TaxID=2615069 RepID=UPI0012E3F98C|nr:MULTISPECIES: hypothetical protein [unclassified Nocardioides]